MSSTKVYPNLPDIIRQISLQLEEAQLRRINSGGSKFLKLKQLEFEMKCVAVESNDLKGGFDLKVVSLGAATKLESQQVHTIKVVFEGMPDFKGGRCSECGSASTGKRTDGCDFCKVCGAVGSCG